MPDNLANNLSDLYTALSLAQGEFPVIEKGSINPHYKSKYADLADINKAITPSLSKHGLCIIQLIQPDPTKAIVKTMLCHKSGASIESIIEITPTATTPQSMGSAYTYARRYSLQAMLNLAADDDDGNLASEQTASKTEKKTYSHLDFQFSRKLREQINTGIEAGYKKAIEKWLNDNQIDPVALSEEQSKQALSELLKIRGTFKKDGE